MTSLPPISWEFESVQSQTVNSSSAPVTVAGADNPSALAATSSEACNSHNEALLPREFAPDLSGASAQERPLSDLESDTQNIPELFSVYAARRCKDLISPPIKQEPREYTPNFDALYSAITNSHPRDLDLDPPPLFLRKPRPAFLRALFELGDAR